MYQITVSKWFYKYTKRATSLEAMITIVLDLEMRGYVLLRVSRLD